MSTGRERAWDRLPPRWGAPRTERPWRRRPSSVRSRQRSLLHRWAPPPSADVARGTEDAFAEGLHRRELPPRLAPIRWTTDRATFTFDPSSAAVTRRPRGGPGRSPRRRSSSPPTASSSASFPPASASARFALPATGRRSRDVRLEVPVFVAGDGRMLGARLERVTVKPRDHGAPSLALLALLAGAGDPRRGGRTGWACRLVAATAFARGRHRLPVGAPVAERPRPLALCRAPRAPGRGGPDRGRRVRLARRTPPTPGAGRWALIAMTAAWFVQWLLATSP